MKKIAVILCGSGFKDGSEIRESVAVLWGLSSLPVEVQCFAPNLPQKDVINCLTQEPMAEQRNMWVESARIARGEVKDLETLHESDFDALIIPGGFGVAKNLCSFASEGSKGSVIPTLQKKLEQFFEAKKPIGAVCIAPAVLALAFKGKELELTVGAAGEAAQEIEKLGHHHIVKKVEECHVDIKNKIVTTPAYMYGDAKLHLLFQGVQGLCNAILEL